MPVLLAGAVAVLLQPLGAAVVAAAPPPGLALPVDCEVGTVCHIQNLFDHDPAAGFRDYHCGRLGYDGHDGTDIRLANLAVMRRGVAVIAAAPGRVRAVRDGMPDVDVAEVGRAAVRGREAGNAVVLRHGEAWETQYSHLRRGSVRVKPGDAVRTGQVLGQIGLSGNTEFPHLHFEVRHRGTPVDPFVGLERSAACGAGAAPLWDRAALQALAYRPTGLLQAGFATRRPESGALANGLPDPGRLPSDAPALLFWVEIYGAQAGDRQWSRLVAPDGGVVVENSAVMPGHKATWMSYIGRKRRGAAWPAGVYRAHYRLERQGGDGLRRILDLERTLEVE